MIDTINLVARLREASKACRDVSRASKVPGLHLRLNIQEQGVEIIGVMPNNPDETLRHWHTVSWANITNQMVNPLPDAVASVAKEMEAAHACAD